MELPESLTRRAEQAQAYRERFEIMEAQVKALTEFMSRRRSAMSQVERYEQGMLIEDRTGCETEGCYEYRCSKHGKPLGTYSLPHSCDEWKIGDVDDLKQLIDDATTLYVTAQIVKGMP
jgi:hypothetical protein